ncbi:hypothetical protein ID866_10026 [Astraeus odoratus]|nr:hypothetical protein ID866_10026 [Astraeus odoratus]
MLSRHRNRTRVSDHAIPTPAASGHNYNGSAGGFAGGGRSSVAVPETLSAFPVTIPPAGLWPGLNTRNTAND